MLKSGFYHACWCGGSLLFFLTFGIVLADLAPASADAKSLFVGSEKCKECHEEIYESYIKNSQKAHSFASVTVMMKKLTPEEIKGCYQCHTTGYGQPGGFISFEETPHMANAGCEVCHGPGGKHIQTESAEDIRAKIAVSQCLSCHNDERIESFNYKPLIYGGGH